MHFLAHIRKKVVPSTSSPSPSGRDPSKVRSRPAGYTQAERFFYHPLLPSSLMNESLRPRRIGMNPVATVHLRAGGTERGGTAWERSSPRGYIRYPHGYKALVHRGVKLRIIKKIVLFLQICNFCSTFAANLMNNKIL